MSEEFYAVLTEKGFIELLKCIEEGREFDASYMAVGDSNGSYYEPLKTALELKNKKFEDEIFKKGKKDNYLYFDLQIPPSSGGYTIREAGVFSSADELLILAKYPETYKIEATGTSDKTLNIEIQLELSDTVINSITIDNSGNLATVYELEKSNEKITDHDERLSSLEENKADIDLSNITQEGRITAAGLCMPSDTYETLTIGANGTTYTAPANGYFSFINAGVQPVCVENVTKKLRSASYGKTDYAPGAFVPASKGDSLKISYLGTLAANLYFVYAKGEN